MNIRHYLPKFIAITAVVVLAATSSCFGTVLNVPQYNQEQDQWCWDASSQMILAYYSHACTQTEIANWAVGGQNVPNYLFNPPSSCPYKPCTEVLSHFGSISSSGSASYISLSTLGNEMANSRPVMIGVSWDGGGGHAIILRGTDGEYVYVNDPWPSNGQSVQTYNGVRRYLGQGTWSQTLQLTSSPANDNYTLYQYYYNIGAQYEALYNSYGYLALAYANIYYANAWYYYVLYYNGNEYLANTYLNLYTSYAYYYYYAYYGYYHYANAAYNYYLAYTYCYYAYYGYYYYIARGDSSSANEWFNYYIYWAQYYYERS